MFADGFDRPGTFVENWGKPYGDVRSEDGCLVAYAIGTEYCKLVDFFTDYATMSPDGMLTGVRPGEVMAVAMDANLNKEIWPVTVA